MKDLCSDKKVLALDLATNCGWAFSGPKKIVSGVWKLKGEDDGHRLHKLRVRLDLMHKSLGIKILAYEDPGGALRGRSARVLPQLCGIVGMWAHENEIPLIQVQPKKLKKFATGNGNASKEMMISAAQHQWPGLGFDSDDECDAIWVLSYALTELEKR